MYRNDVFDYVRKKYGTEPEYLWMKHPGYAVFRQSDNRKWYGLIGNLQKVRLGLGGDGDIDMLNTKCEPEWTYIFRQQKGILPAYHMNKEHWITILLDGSVAIDTIFELLDYSHLLTCRRQRKSVRPSTG